jgi:hypothetical protein
MRWFVYIKTLLRLYKELNKQKRFINSFLDPYLKELESKYDGVFQPEQLKKIRHYYGLFIPTILCSSYKELYDEAFTNDERKRATLFGILTPVGDDLFDIDKLDVPAIQTITYHPETYNATTFSGKVAKEVQAFMLHDVKDKEAYLLAAKNVFEIQFETIKQTNPAIDFDEMERITYAKGGYSVIIYHQILNRLASEQLTEVLFYVGSLMQFDNDLYDMFKDLRDGITTMPDSCPDFYNLKQRFLNRVKETNRLIDALPFSKNKKIAFGFAMHFIISSGLPVFDKMMELEQKYGKPLDFKNLSRKELICDMQQTKNVLRWVKYMFTIPSMR